MGKKPNEINELEQEIIKILAEKFRTSHMTYGRLEQLTGIPSATLNKTFNNRRASTIDQLESLAKGFSLSLSTVVRRAEENLAPTQITSLDERRQQTMSEPATTLESLAGNPHTTEDDQSSYDD